MQTTRPLVAVVVTILVVGSAMVGVGGAQRGPPDDTGPSEDGGPPAGIHSPELVVTDVSVNPADSTIEVTVTNTGKQPVSIALAEIEAVQNRTVVRDVVANQRNVTANLFPSTTTVATTGGGRVEVLKNINFKEESAITDVVFQSATVDVVKSISHEPAGVVTSIDPETPVVQNITEIHTRPSEDRSDVANVVRKSIEYVRDPTAVVGDALKGIIVGDQIAPVFALLVKKIDVVGPGDWDNGTVVGSIEVESPQQVVSSVNFQVTDRSEFLKRTEPGTGTDPTPFKETVEVLQNLATKQVVGKISWTTPAVVDNITVLDQRIPITETSVWDVPRANGTSEVSLRPRESTTIRLELIPAAKLSGTPPQLETAAVIDGWLYDENGNELTHFLAKPGS